MDAEKKQRTGILLIFLIIFGYLTFYSPFGSQDGSNDTDKQPDQKAKKTFLDKLRAKALQQSPDQPEPAFTLENDDICCVFSAKGAQIRQVTQKKFTRYAQKTPISSWDNKYSYDNLSGLIPKGKDSSQAVTVSELDFELLPSTDNAITFSYKKTQQKA